ncbi:hypothetical protein CLU79DRAFT_839244 [Phycomyces nitens]|nr:hypothetical protein CLU79DRAFT_839244 [Phycomyces nitens]
MKFLGVLSSLIFFLAWSSNALSVDPINDIHQLNVHEIKDSLRLQRDISCNVTINHYLWPTINLTSSYFGTNFSRTQLDSVDTLLSLGYMRLELDIYWEPAFEIWQLCPVDLVDKNSAEDQIIDRFICTTNSLEILLGSISRYLTSTQISNEPLKTNLVMLILHVHGSENQSHPLELLSDNIAKAIVPSAVYTSRIYTPNDYAYDQKNELDNSTQWPQWIRLVERRFQLLTGFGNQSAKSNDNNKTVYNEGIIFGAGTFGNPVYLDDSAFSRDTCYKTLESPLSEPPSWSVVGKTNQSLSADEISQVIHCGKSPVFDASVSGTDYKDLLENTIENMLWTWDEGQPPKDNKVTCAVMQRSNGRWRVSDCTEEFNIACRHKEEPGKWIISNATATYEEAFLVCPDDYFFDTPRTPWQNQQLLNSLQGRTDLFDKDSLEDSVVWINLNSVISAQCWVIGRSTLCWWLNKASETTGSKALWIESAFFVVILSQNEV